MEPRKEKGPVAKSKEAGGCWYFIVRGAFGVAIVFLIDFTMSLIFHSLYPHNSVTTDLIPFQNGYLATTNAFITSEGVITQFSGDPGPTARFLSICILPMVALFVVALILAFIPIINKVVQYTWQFGVIILFALMIYALFFPPVMTVFDREQKVMIVHESTWYMSSEKTEIPFDQISGFTYQIEEVDGHDHYEEIVNADLYAITSNGRVFIGENEIGFYNSHDSKEPYVVSQSRIREIERTIRALEVLTGKTATPI